MRILVIDDDEVSLKMFQNALRLNGFDCNCYMNSVEAFQEILGESYDIIFTDYNMPTMDGIELISRAKSSGIESQMVLFTGYVDSSVQIKAKEVGADGFLQKPVSWQNVNNLLENLMVNKSVN